MAVLQAIGPHAVGANSIQPQWPAHDTGDVALLIVESSLHDQAVNLAVPAGFAPVPNSPQVTGNPGGRLSVFWARATSAAMGAPTLNGPTDHIQGQIITFRGCPVSGDPWNVVLGGIDMVSDASLSIPGGVTSIDNCLLVFIVANIADADTPRWSGWANPDLANLTERVDLGTLVGNGGGLAVVTGEKAAAGAFGPTTATAAAATQKMFLALALKAAATQDTEAPGPLTGLRIVNAFFQEV